MSKAAWIPVIVLGVLAVSLAFNGVRMLAWDGDREGVIGLGLACFCVYAAAATAKEGRPTWEKRRRQCARAAVGLAALFISMGGINHVLSGDTLTGSLYIAAAAMLVVSYIRLGWERENENSNSD